MLCLDAKIETTGQQLQIMNNSFGVSLVTSHLGVEAQKLRFFNIRLVATERGFGPFI